MFILLIPYLVNVKVIYLIHQIIRRLEGGISDDQHLLLHDRRKDLHCYISGGSFSNS